MLLSFVLLGEIKVWVRTTPVESSLGYNYKGMLGCPSFVFPLKTQVSNALFIIVTAKMYHQCITSWSVKVQSV